MPSKSLAAIVRTLSATRYCGPCVLPPARVKRHPLRGELRRAARLRTIERALYILLAASFLLAVGGAIQADEILSRMPICRAALAR